MSKKYSFIEFLAALEGDDFNTIKESNLIWAKNFANMKIDENDTHRGDCTNESTPCKLCSLQYHLELYKDYVFKGIIPE